jgi:hypothetical protein
MGSGWPTSAPTSARARPWGRPTNQVIAIATDTIPDSVSLSLGPDSARIGEVLGGFLQTLGFSVICMLVVLFLPFGRC